MTKNKKSPQTGSMNPELTGITKVSIESVKKTRLENLTPFLNLLVATVAVAISIFSVVWSTTITTGLAQQNVEQQKVSWSLTLLSQLTSNNAGLQKFAAATFYSLYKKGTIPDELLPALREAAGDPKTNPDAARILRNLLGSKRYSSSVQLGTNTFDFATFPISLDNKRFFLIGSEKEQYFVSVIIVDGNNLSWEVVDNKPIANPLSHPFSTRSGMLVVCSLKTGDVIYKVSVGSEIGLSYFSPSKPQVVRVTQSKLTAGGVTLMRNKFMSGGSVGIVLDSNGGIGIGTRAPMDVIELYKRALGEKTIGSHLNY